MSSTIQTTIDAAGRLVVPKALRDQAGLVPGLPLVVSFRDGRIEIEPLPRPVRIVERDGFRVAEPVGQSEPLARATVRRVRDSLREGRKRR